MEGGEAGCLQYLFAQVMEQNLLEPRNCSAGAYFPQYSHFRRFAFLSSSENKAAREGCIGFCCHSGPRQAQRWTLITRRVPPKDLLNLTENLPKTKFKIQSRKKLSLKNITVFLTLSQTISTLND